LTARDQRRHIVFRIVPVVLLCFIFFVVVTIVVTATSSIEPLLQYPHQANHVFLKFLRVIMVVLFGSRKDAPLSRRSLPATTLLFLFLLAPPNVYLTS
jgi:hypothetical protein